MCLFNGLINWGACAWAKLVPNVVGEGFVHKADIRAASFTLVLRGSNPKNGYISISLIFDFMFFNFL